jgi:hypothetical protein
MTLAQAEGWGLPQAAFDFAFVLVAGTRRLNPKKGTKQHVTWLKMSCTYGEHWLTK